ncbi:MAG: glycosyl transferase [Betaproteobacteria bacterium]|nr:glycosyl transferase [Betaproteobacteria bacterium]
MQPLVGNRPSCRCGSATRWGACCAFTGSRGLQRRGGNGSSLEVPLPLRGSRMITAMLAGALATFISCWALVLTQAWHGRFTHDGSHGVQKFHVHPTPRIGGVGLMIGMLAVQWQAPAEWTTMLGTMLLAALPAFLFGTAEDLSKRVAPRVRLLATMGSGVAASLLSGTALAHTGLPWFDSALQAWWPLAVAFTAFAVGGVANAVNIVDGFNGLASGLVIICLCALGAMALQAGDDSLAGLLFATAGVAAGFLVVNFPLGKVFLGDGGAYVLGFWLAWLAVLLIERNPRVSPAAVLLACFYPVVEVVFSIYRRTRRAYPAMRPDRLHLHSLVKCRISRKRLARWPAVMQNASVSPFVWMIASGPAVLGVCFWNFPMVAWACLAGFVVTYGMIYRRLALFGWH